MNESQYILSLLHDELGLSDNDIAYIGDLTRNYINLVRNGKRELSNNAQNLYIEAYNKLKQRKYKPERKPYGTSKQKKNTKPATKIYAPVQTAQNTIFSNLQTNNVYACTQCKSIDKLQSYVMNGVTLLLCKNCISSYEETICNVCKLSYNTTRVCEVRGKFIQICATCFNKYRRNIYTS